MVRSVNTMTFRPSAASFPHEMHSVWTPAPPRPPKTVLSVVIWIAATWGLACPLPRWAATVVAVIWMKSWAPRRLRGLPPWPARAAVAAHDVQRDLVGAKEVFFPFDK